MTQIGTAEQERSIAVAHDNGFGLPADVEELGSGSHRTVYLDRATRTVYKVGLDGANRQEVRTLAGLRHRGMAHAPEAVLYEIAYTDWTGNRAERTVVAMPYLPDDGSVPGPYPVLEGAADLHDTGNVHANGGRLWLIDAGGM